MSSAADTAWANQQGSWKPKYNPWIVAIVVTLAAFMEVLDTTIVNVALPHIAGSMSATYEESTWTLTSYLVANSIVLPISAFFGRLLGRKRYFLISIVMFTVCSLLCGLATELWQLILFRLMQGFFGGGLQPIQQSVLLDYFPPEKRSQAFSMSALAIIVAPIIGPVMGGVITDHVSWRWVFLINVPIGIIAALAIYTILEDPPWERQAKKGSLRIDYIGIALIAIGLGFLEITLDRGQTQDWFASTSIRITAVLAVAGIVGAVYWLLYAKHPVINLDCLKDRNFAVACLMIFCFAGSLYGSSILIPQLAQQQLGYTATQAGLVLMPGALMMIVLIMVVARLMPHIQTRYLVAFGFVLLTLSMLYSRHLVPNIDFKTLVSIRVAQSMAIGFLFVPLTTLAYVTLKGRLSADGTALFTMFRNVAGSIGIAMATASVLTRSQTHMAYLSENLSPFSSSYTDSLSQLVQSIRNTAGWAGDAAQSAAVHLYQTLLSQATIMAYIDVFSFISVLSFLCIPLCFLFSPVKARGGAAH